ncbi:uncharacterized protein N0V89_012311 [Didymosphaeria variabile]|uniref:Concanavalin A-like lectin/glucanase n=1 Tax=Didymosphaeria variabile TaxID=1932322 RepID=A0A9W8X8X5_9PLEO|nr:uncharacterized protein N0V89_012311 [Didymosphaeria variabile]KAJ4344567.1 hypothetical protein N0V89_012311 [Didymosphaeria variabile]
MKVYAAVAALVALAQANLDVVTLNVNGDNYITEANATLVLGKAPSPQGSGDAALWSAIMMDKQDFLQGVTQNSAADYWCANMPATQWCNFAYTLVGSQVTAGKAVPASPGSKVKTTYKLNSSTQLWDQNVYIDGKLVSTVNTSKGQHGKIFYISLECAQGTCAAASAHSWEDVTIVLNKADTSFKHSGSWEYGATGGEMSTSDNGKTWKLSTLSIPQTVPQ